jgi:hypothetical protein
MKEPIPALTGERAQIPFAERLRSDHVHTLMDMARNVTGRDPVSSSVAKLLHVAMRQQQAAWWVRHAPARQTVDLVVELAEQLAVDGRMDAEMLQAVVQEVHRLRYGVAGGRRDVPLGL